MGLWRATSRATAALTNLQTLSIPADPKRISLFVSAAVPGQCSLFSADTALASQQFAVLRLDVPNLFISNVMAGTAMQGPWTIRNDGTGTAFVSMCSTFLP